MNYKSCPAFKATADGDNAEFEAIVSVFGNIDSVGDVVMPGAFADSLAEWKTSGDPIPVLWSHRMDDPRFSIGEVLDIAELNAGDPRIPEWAGDHLLANGGLWVKGRLHSGPDASDVATAARKLLKQRLVKQFSYAYDVIDAGWGTVDGREAYELRKMHIHEVSSTQIGANNLTQLLGAKAAALVASAPELGSDPVKLRELLSTMGSDDIREAQRFITKTLTERTTDGNGAPESRTVKPEEPDGVKGEEPARPDVESTRLLSDLLTTELEYVS